MVYSLNNNTIVLRILRKIIFLRKVEEHISINYHKQKMRCPVHLSIGQEAVSTAFSEIVEDDDYAMSSHRSHLHYLAKGGDLRKMLCEIHGKQQGCSSGKGGSMHLIDLKKKFMGSTAIVGNSIPISAGLGLSLKLNKKKNISYIFFGDGAVEEGVFYETINLSAVKQIPMIFVCENNFFSVYTSLKDRQPKKREIYKMVEAIGVKSLFCDGNDVFKCLHAFKKAKAYVKKFKKPIFIEFKTYRHLEHCGPNNDDSLNYRSKSEIKHWLKKDPLILLKNKIIRKKIFSAEFIKKLEDQIDAIISKEMIYAEKAKFPDLKNAIKGIYA